MLRQLLISILENRMDKSLIKEVGITIVDNDIFRSAETVVKEINERARGNTRLFYYNYPIKGLSHVRNELLNKALLQQPDFMIFIDDDEFVTPDWLIELSSAIVKNDADIVRGPVIAKLDDDISKYIAYFFRRKGHPDNSRIYSLATGNLIMRRKSLEEFNVRFDNRFNSTGSEDSYFGIQLMKKGAKIFWAANATVYETIPDNRATLKWLIKRMYNGALTYTYILKLEKKYLGLLKKTIVSGVYILIGSLALLTLPFPFEWRYWGILKISEGIGGFAGLLDMHFDEYAKDR